MARIRTIKPDFFKNEQIAELPPIIRLFFIGLWTQADRAGKLEDRPKRLKAEIVPYEDFDADFALNVLQSAGLLMRYVVNDSEKVHHFIKIITFTKHQQPNVKEAVSTIPEPTFDDIPLKHGASTVQALQERKGKEQERKGKEGERRTLRFSPPTFEMVFEYFDFKKNDTLWTDEKNKFQAQKFIDHYTSNGWKVGKNKMTVWKSAAAGWINRDKEFTNEKILQKNNLTNNGKQTNNGSAARTIESAAIEYFNEKWGTSEFTKPD